MTHGRSDASSLARSNTSVRRLPALRRLACLIRVSEFSQVRNQLVSIVATEQQLPGEGNADVFRLAFGPRFDEPLVGEFRHVSRDGAL